MCTACLAPMLHDSQICGNTGAVLDFLMDPDGTVVASVSAALEARGLLLLGNLAGDHVSYLDLAQDAARRTTSSS
jgi:hypothetical protein